MTEPAMAGRGDDFINTIRRALGDRAADQLARRVRRHWILDDLADTIDQAGADFEAAFSAFDE